MVKVIQLFNNEKSLIRKAAEGNRDAQKKLYETHSPKMLSICRMYIKDFHHAEEAMLNGFLKVFENLDSFEGKGSFEGWVRRIMVRESISFLRVYKKPAFSEDLPDHISEVTAEINTEMNVADIQSIIDDLPEGYRMVFVLYAIEGYKHHEISKMLDISEGTSKSQLFKARKMLQERINKLNASGYGTN